MAGLLRKRKGKAPASTSEAPRFKTLYHESHFNKFFAAREVLPKIRIKIDDDALSQISVQINLRKWQRLTKLFLTVGYSLVREFYANAWRLEEQKNQPLTNTTQIRGTEINFSPESIHRVLKLRDTPLPNAASYHDRKANNNLRLDEVLACLYVEGAQWVRHPDGRPHSLRRIDLQPMARGAELSMLLSSNGNESMLFPYQNTTRKMREIEQQGIPITMANLNIYRAREEEMRRERMRYEKVLEEVAAQKAKEQNKGKARGVEEYYDDEEIEDEGGEW
ncbi:hypothetical protein PIB30_059009 [Stylosanthes scabra]|uniref:Putative plant transposon protein domain-containing protein n=1 Tax=Stylosanthes scabra TaxID=79078 RepID=A0ABU6ZIV0_9FABA|nr:hypothetical protein [Stylosanthes scabra]